jgi:hypothetical protein
MNTLNAILNFYTNVIPITYYPRDVINVFHVPSLKFLRTSSLFYSILILEESNRHVEIHRTALVCFVRHPYFELCCAV